MSPRAMPAQKPGKSEQAVQTPPEFLAAVARRFGPIRWDLAANASNHVAPGWYGPGSPDGEDALAQDWSKRGGVLFLNPEFGNIPPFAKLAAEFGPRGARTKMLVPAAVSTEWWVKFVHQRALVLFLRPRIKFVGHDAGFPKDLALCAYGPWVAPGYSTWRWDADEVAAP